MKSGPELCVAADIGGGVAIGDTFLVYSVAVVPEIPLVSADSLPRLEAAAKAVAEKLPIHLENSNIDLSQLGRVPFPGDPAAKMIRRLPWFYIHAAGFKKHAVVGKISLVDTLLRVLSRPWCVLELCCMPDKENISALLRFAHKAYELDSKIYTGAVRLITHELETRDAPDSTRYYLDDQPSPLLEEVYAALFLPSENSYNSLWLRIIYTCALQLNVSFSELGRLLDSESVNNEDSLDDVAQRLRQVIGQINGRGMINGTMVPRRTPRPSMSMVDLRSELPLATKPSSTRSATPEPSDEPLYRSFVQLYSKLIAYLTPGNT